MEKSGILKNICNIIFISGLYIITSTALGNELDIKSSHQVKDGYAVYIGLMPAEMLEGHTSGTMHGGIPIGQYRYHLAIAIFDDKTGKRIKNAIVQVAINNKNGIGMESNKTLENMELNGKIIYGNYFTLKTAGPFHVVASINIGNSLKPIKVEFDYDFAHT